MRSKPNSMWAKAASTEPRVRPDYSHIEPAVGDLGMVKFAGKAARQKAVVSHQDGTSFFFTKTDCVRGRWLVLSASQEAIGLFRAQEASQ